MLKMNPESKLVLAAAEKIVSGKENDINAMIGRKDVDWDLFKDAMSYHGIVSLTHIWFKSYYSLLPKNIVDVLQASYYYSLLHVSKLQYKFLELHEVFEKKGVIFVPIKGVALLEDLYSDNPARLSSDIDVLVREEDLDIAVKILQEQGYQKELYGLKESYWRNKQYHFIFTKKLNNEFSPIVELHWDLDYRRYRRHLLPRIFNRLRGACMQDRKVKLLSPEDTFFALALHQRRFGIALSLRDVCDMARLLNKYAPSFDWNYVLDESKRSNVCSTIYFAICQVSVLFNINVPGYVHKGLNVPAWKKIAIRNFIQKNTFLQNQHANNKRLYLKAHFLLYDNIWEPIDYILNIPQEQFAKFYGLDTYSKKTEFFYRYRLFYIFLKRAVFYG